MATWQPVWQPATAYLATAVVIPTTFAGFTWRCTAPGTSGNSEPTWPADPSVSPTIVDGGVTWSVGTGFRQAIQAAILSVLGTFIAANPTIIRTVRTVRPRSFTTVDLPCFYVGALNESVTHANGIRTRTVEGFSAYLVDNLGEQIESNDRFNFAVDALTDLFTASYHAISGRSILEHTGTIDTETDEGGTAFAAAEFTFGRTFVAEGRT
jgi:hypothetical protein